MLRDVTHWTLKWFVALIFTKNSRGNLISEMCSQLAKPPMNILWKWPLMCMTSRGSSESLVSALMRKRNATGPLTKVARWDENCWETTLSVGELSLLSRPFVDPWFKLNWGHEWHLKKKIWCHHKTWSMEMVSYMTIQWVIQSVDTWCWFIGGFGSSKCVLVPDSPLLVELWKCSTTYSLFNDNIP